jgi:periplasmic protein TonB
MFERSLVESRGLVGTGTERWTALGSAAFQLMLAALVVTLPLLRPQSLPKFVNLPQLTMPLPMRPPDVPVRVRMASSDSTALSVPSVPAPIASGPRIFSLQPGITDEPAPGPITAIQIGGGPIGLAALGPAGAGPNVTVVRAGPIAPVNVSTGVSEGMLLAPIRPIYPEIARVTHTQGTVVIEAMISKAGRIESLQAVSGPGMLRQAALDAVGAARYRPFLLSGQPVEVQTRVTVVFSLGE